MRVFRVIAVSFLACVTAAGAVFAADEPLEIHGGGRVGWTTNGKLGAETGIASNELGAMPNYASSNYFGISLAKKVTADGGAWAKTSVYLDFWNNDIPTDLQLANWRRRDFHVEFGGLDFLPKDTILWGGLRGFSAGGNSQQDHAFINFAGMGFGLQNVGGVASLMYLHEKSTTDTQQYEGLGMKVTHNIVASVNVPLVDVFGAFGFSKKAKDVTADPYYDLNTGAVIDGYTEDGTAFYNATDYTLVTPTAQKQKNYTAAFVGAVVHAPMGINLGALFATNGYARMAWNDKRGDTFSRGGYVSNDEATVDSYKLRVFSLTAIAVTDLAPGLYTATSVCYDNGKGSSKSAFLQDNTANVLHISSRWSKGVTQNIAVVGTIGYGREWAKKDDADVTKDVKQTIQFTPSVEIGLNTGYGASPKLQFYGTYTKVDSKHKPTTGAYADKTSRIDFGMLCTFGF
jgi:hypothetical protein